MQAVCTLKGWVLTDLIDEMGKLSEAIESILAKKIETPKDKILLLGIRCESDDQVVNEKVQ